MTNYKRYAIFHAPTSGVLAQKAARWLGWDAVTGEAPAHPELRELPRSIRKLTARPRKYGFHGTLRAPFRAAPGLTEKKLRQLTDQMACGLAPVGLDGLVISALGPFLALQPVGDTAPLSALAASVVEATNSWRTPMTEEDLARRNPSRLSDAQLLLLNRWGYPYVMDEFRFHMTLTGPLPGPERGLVRHVLSQYFDGSIPEPYQISDLCLFGEAEDGRFRLISRHALRG